MSDNWRTDPTGPALPDEFDRMRQVAVLPLGPDWFERQGVPMKEAEVEDGWPLLHGTIRTDDATFVVIGAQGDDAVGLWADKDMEPQAAVDALEAAMEHGATASVFDETQLSE